MSGIIWGPGWNARSGDRAPAHLGGEDPGRRGRPDEYPGSDPGRQTGWYRPEHSPSAVPVETRASLRRRAAVWGVVALLLVVGGAVSAAHGARVAATVLVLLGAAVLVAAGWLLRSSQRLQVGRGA